VGSYEEILIFFNRVSVRPINDITAHVTAKVTVEMDPEGMGAHMGREETLQPPQMERGARIDSMALMNTTMQQFIKDSEAREEARRQEAEKHWKEAEAREEARKQEFEELKKESQILKKASEEFKKECQAKEDAQKKEFEELKKESEAFKKESEAKEQARKQEAEQSKQEAETLKKESEAREEAKEQARKQEAEALKQESEAREEAKEQAHKHEAEQNKEAFEAFKRESEAREEAKEQAHKHEAEAKEEAFKKDIGDLKKLVKSSRKRPAARSGKGPAAKKRCRGQTETYIVCNDGVYSLRMWINGLYVDQGRYSTHEKAEEALHLHVNGSRHIRDMLGRK